jgi:hypothetical protein
MVRGAIVGALSVAALSGRAFCVGALIVSTLCEGDHSIGSTRR